MTEKIANARALLCIEVPIKKQAQPVFISFRFDNIRIELLCLMYEVYKFTKYFTF